MNTNGGKLVPNIIFKELDSFEEEFYICATFAGVVKLVDTLDLGSSAVRCGGSSPFTRTFFLSELIFYRM